MVSTILKEKCNPKISETILGSMWWAVVTLTTVGYGDVYPTTPGGKIFTAIVTLIGVGLIAIPSGLLASVLTEARVGRKKAEESEENVENESAEGIDK